MRSTLRNYLFVTLKLFSVFLLFFSPCLYAAKNVASSNMAGGEIKKTVIDHAKLSSVMIETEISASAYSCGSGKFYGSGFVVDRKNGIICTNSHVIGGPCLAESYFVTFHNGAKLEARLLYYDVWQDLGFLKVESKEIPSEVGQLTFAKNGFVKEGDRVFSISNTEKAAFSFNLGYLSSLYSAKGFMPQHSYVVNYNQVGGSSGAAVLNDNGQIVGVNFGGSQSFRLAVDSRYVQYILKFIAKGEVPVRRHTGAVLNFYSLADAVRYRGFPKDISEKYIKEHPLARGNVIEVDSCILGSPAYEFLSSGDIIWKINGVPVVADLCELDRRINESKDPVTINLYRYGKGFIDIQVNTYDVNKNRINKIVDFCNARFVSADCFIARYKGVKLGAVFCLSSEGSSPFVLEGLGYSGSDSECAFAVLEMNSEKISSLEDLIHQAQKMKKDENVGFMLKSSSRLPYYHFGRHYTVANNVFLKDIKLKNDFKLEVHEFNNEKLRWIKTIK